MDTFLRYDYSSLGSKVKVTPQGFIRVPATLSRVGVVSYNYPDGTVVKELRPPEEVLKADSIATLKGAPVTIGHRAMIDPGNVSEYSAGFISDSTAAEAAVEGELTLQRRDAIEAAQAKELKELSPGYSCRLEDTPGVYKGERYDRVQRDIVYNHIALLPAGAGRQGSEVAIKMDSNTAIAVYDNKAEAEPLTKELKIMDKDLIKITLDGVLYTVETPKGMGSSLEAAVAKLDSKANESSEATAELEGKLEAAAKEIKDLQTKLDAAEAPEAVQAKVAERLELVAKAKELSPELKLDGLSNHEVKMAALEAVGYSKESLEGKPEAYLDGLFMATKADSKKAAPAVLPGVSPEPAKKAKEDKLDSKDAYNRMLERNRAAWNNKEV